MNDRAERRASHEALFSLLFQNILQPLMLLTVVFTLGEIQLQKYHTAVDRLHSNQRERTQSHNSEVSEIHWIVTG